jgi:hypothetical protein
LALGGAGAPVVAADLGGLLSGARAGGRAAG